MIPHRDQFGIVVSIYSAHLDQHQLKGGDLWTRHDSREPLLNLIL